MGRLGIFLSAAGKLFGEFEVLVRVLFVPALLSWITGIYAWTKSVGFLKGFGTPSGLDTLAAMLGASALALLPLAWGLVAWMRFVLINERSTGVCAERPNSTDLIAILATGVYGFCLCCVSGGDLWLTHRLSGSDGKRHSTLGGGFCRSMGCFLCFLVPVLVGFSCLCHRAGRVIHGFLEADTPYYHAKLLNFHFGSSLLGLLSK